MTGQSFRYTCPSNSECVFDCGSSNITCNSNGAGIVLIDAANATSLELYCHEPNACADMLVECPINAPDTSCVVNCDLDNSCNGLQIYTHNVTQFGLLCGANEDDAEVANSTQCTDIVIDGLYGQREDTVPDVQGIAIICNDESGGPNTEIPSCDNIS